MEELQLLGYGIAAFAGLALAVVIAIVVRGEVKRRIELRRMNDELRRIYGGGDKWWGKQ